jgi:prepilin-type N-terminal cleavage/methylation domain-containing protein
MKPRRSRQKGSAPSRAARHTRDVSVAERHQLERGFTLIEMVVTFALAAILMGIAVPHLPDRNYGLWTAHTQVIADIRQARADSIVKGDHFEVRIEDDQHYSVWRLRDPEFDGTWVADPQPVRSRVLPDNVRFTEGVGASFAFNTRGLMVIPEAADSLRLQDTHNGQERTVTIWPSGQIAPTETPDLDG